MGSTFSYIDTTDAGKSIINDNRDLYYGRETAGSPEKVIKKKGKVVQVIPAVPAGRQPAAQTLDPQYINKNDLGAIDISGYRIKGYWYFDKRQGELKYRLLGICPVSVEARDIGKDTAEVIDLFWVYFPAAREALHDAYAFNDRNSAMPFSFDHLLNSRRFNGVIYKEENVFGDRLIQDYMKENAQNQLLEAARVKEKIRDFESDMWNY